MTKNIRQVTKPALRPISKDRPDLGFPDGRLASLKTESRVSEPARLRPLMPERQDLHTQIAALSKSIDNDLAALVGLIKRGRKDRATIVCGIVDGKRKRMQTLIDKRNAILAGEASEPVPVNRKPSTSIKVKTKRFARWSDNP